VGRKIVAQKEVAKLQESIRPTLATDALNRKKLSGHDNHRNKLSVQEFNEERSPHECHPEDSNRNGVGHVWKGERNNKSTYRKRLKSKSLENLKVKYYAKSP
jgi:dethiobiotin synthetase